MTDYFLLTGAKNNAGDFLIGKRATELLDQVRPDRTYEIIDRSIALEGNLLDRINSSRCLILTGGPSVQPGMWPKIYPLAKDLNDIKVPIVTFGVGWKSHTGIEGDYKLSQDTLKLLRRINESGYKSSVRDFSTQRVLRNYGFENFLMTGCPALYTDKKVPINSNKSKPLIVFSTGVSFVESPSMFSQMMKLLDLLMENDSIELKVAYHHSTDIKSKKSKFYLEHEKLRAHLSSRSVPVVDVSGGVEKMERLYDEAAFHIGYRVHAHIYMTSIGKLSFLLAEDGRGMALQEVLGENVFNGFEHYRDSIGAKIVGRVLPGFDRYRSNQTVPGKVYDELKSTLKNSDSSLERIRTKLDEHKLKMTEFLSKLP